MTHADYLYFLGVAIATLLLVSYAVGRISAAHRKLNSLLKGESRIMEATAAIAAIDQALADQTADEAQQLTSLLGAVTVIDSDVKALLTKVASGGDVDVTATLAKIMQNTNALKTGVSGVIATLTADDAAANANAAQDAADKEAAAQAAEEKAAADAAAQAVADKAAADAAAQAAADKEAADAAAEAAAEKAAADAAAAGDVQAATAPETQQPT